MRTKNMKEVVAMYPQYATLIRSVVRQIGADSIQDVIEHGADAGFSGFIYYADTCKFYRNHKKDILRLLDDVADCLGYRSSIELVKEFGCMRGQDGLESRIGKAIYGKCGKDTEEIENALSWFALEECCRMFER